MELEQPRCQVGRAAAGSRRRPEITTRQPLIVMVDAVHNVQCTVQWSLTTDPMRFFNIFFHSPSVLPSFFIFLSFFGPSLCISPTPTLSHPYLSFPFSISYSLSSLPPSFSFPLLFLDFRQQPYQNAALGAESQTLAILFRLGSQVWRHSLYLPTKPDANNREDSGLSCSKFGTRMLFLAVIAD